MIGRRAFTLIELLVVIAILSILAAILMPVYTSAKQSGKKASSKSNVRQLWAAVHLYAADYDDTFAFGLPRFWADKRQSIVQPDVFANAQIAPYIEDVLAPYGVTDELVRCPGDPGLGGSVYREFKTSYSFRIRAFLVPRTLTYYDVPAERTLIHEADYFFESVRSLDAKRVVVFHDGHAKFVPWRVVVAHMEE